MADIARRDTTAANTSNLNLYPSASFTPVAGDLLIVCAHVTGTALTSPPCTASANGITFTLVETQVSNSGLSFMKYVYVANQLVPASPSAMTVTVNVTGDTGTGCILFVLGATGMTNVGAAAVRQFDAPDTNVPAATTPVNTLAAAPLTTNPLFGFAGNNTGTGASVTPPAGWTELADLGHSTPTAGAEVCKIASGFTNTTVTWGSTMSAGSTSVFELDASAGLTTVGSSRSSTWQVAQTVVSTRASTWATAAVVASTRASTWTVRGTVTATRASTWTVLAAVTATRVSTWTVRAVVTSTRASTWNVDGLTSVGSNRSSTWVTRQTVTATRTGTWTVRAVVTASRSSTWNVSAVATASRASTWTVRATVAASRSSTWRVLAAVATARSSTWTVRALVVATRSSTWNVAGVLVTVGTSRSSTWTVRAVTATSRASTWTVRTTVTSTRAGAWTVRETVVSARTGTWAVLSAVVTLRGSTWAVLASVGTVRTGTWDVLAVVVATRSSTWGVGAPVGSDRASTWAVLELVGASVESTWAVLEEVATSRSSTWEVFPRTEPLPPTDPERTNVDVATSRVNVVTGDRTNTPRDGTRLNATDDPSRVLVSSSGSRSNP